MKCKTCKGTGTFKTVDEVDEDCLNCNGTGIDLDDDDTVPETFWPCDHCDLPDACEDFGCAIKAGIREDPSW